MRANDREVTESVFDRNQRREAEINIALKQEEARHQAAIKNMHRLRLLRLERDAQNTPAKRKAPRSKGPMRGRRFSAVPSPSL